MTYSPTNRNATPDEGRRAISLHELNGIIGLQLSTPALRNIWITAETSDVRVKGGHCYLELIEKEERGDNIKARIRAIIWGNNYREIALKFFMATGAQLASSQKVMVCGSVNYNSAYGMSFVINDIEPSYTVGDIELRRKEILNRLSREGILEMNKQLEWKRPSLRVAVISASDAAGFGDFVHQLYSNNYKFRFHTKLFPAMMQGEKTPTSIIAALEKITDELDNWDTVVIIRGGGSTSDLVSFDNYDLAAHIANFPLPVIVGIGHERDVTVLDYVANSRVKTPTAAAEMLISQAEKDLKHLHTIGTDLLRFTTDKISGCQAQLAYMTGQLPIIPLTCVQQAASRLSRISLNLSGTIDRRINPAKSKLDIITNSLITAAGNLLNHKFKAIDNTENLLKALSPEATLARGYSITRINGHAITSSEGIESGTLIETTFAKGKITSVTR